MFVSNALTPVRGDARYIKKLFSEQDMFDNATSFVTLGPVVTYELFNLEYVLQLPVSKRSHHGMLTVAVTSPTTAELTNHEYTYADSEAEIETVIYAADVNAGDVRLGVTFVAVGENPTFNYRIAAVPAAE